MTSSAEPRKVDAPDLESDVDPQAYNSRPEYRSAFYNYLRKGNSGLMPNEVRALEEGVNGEGGFTVETGLERTIVAKVADQNVLRSVCTIIPIEGNRNVPVESAVGAANWTAEEGAYTEADMTFSQTTLGAHKLAAILKVSDELMVGNVLGDAGFEQYVANYFARIFATAEEAAFANGDGSGKPTGVFNGIAAGQTQAVVTTDTLIPTDLVALYHKLEPQYRFGASWLMHDNVAKVIREMRDASGASAATGNFMWQPGMQAGQPDRLFGSPVLVSNGCPSSVGTGTDDDAGLAVYGDFSYYYIAERGGYQFQRMNELFAATGQVGIRAYSMLDGAVTQGSAFALLTNGS